MVRLAPSRRLGSRPKPRVRRLSEAAGSGRPPLPPRLPAPRGGLDRGANLLVDAAAADVAGQVRGDFLATRVGVLRQQLVAHQYEPGNAVAALRGAGGDELLDHVVVR